MVANGSTYPKLTMNDPSGPCVTLRCSSLQALHGVVLETPPQWISAFRSLAEASAFTLESLKSNRHGTAILAALPDSLSSLDLKLTHDEFEVRANIAGGPRHTND